MNRGEGPPVARPGHTGREPAQGGPAQRAPSSRPPDLSSGTRNVALAINTSYTSVVVRRKSTPLGDRYSVFGVTATGNTRELASLKDAGMAEVVRAHLIVAIDSLERAAATIVRDREGA